MPLPCRMATETKPSIPSGLYHLKVTELKDVCRRSLLTIGGNKSTLTDRISRAWEAGNMACRRALRIQLGLPADQPAPPPPDLAFGNLGSAATEASSAGTAMTGKPQPDTRCICKQNAHNGLMICCDECGMWQHCNCVGIAAHALPEEYICERCRAAHLDPFLPPASARPDSLQAALATAAPHQSQHADSHVASWLLPGANAQQMVQPYPCNMRRLPFALTYDQLQSCLHNQVTTRRAAEPLPMLLHSRSAAPVGACAFARAGTRTSISAHCQQRAPVTHTRPPARRPPTATDLRYTPYVTHPVRSTFVSPTFHPRDTGGGFAAARRAKFPRQRRLQAQP